MTLNRVTAACGGAPGFSADSSCVEHDSRADVAPHVRRALASMARTRGTKAASELTKTAQAVLDCALLLVHALDDDSLVQEAPAIVGGKSPSAVVHAGCGSVAPAH